MSKAFVDTTVLTNVLLKRHEPAGEQAYSALRRYTSTELPQYAIKEFKHGPLAKVVWLHNKLVSTRSWKATLAAIYSVSRTPQRYTVSTALEILTAESTTSLTLQKLVAKYGLRAREDQVLCDEYRLALKSLIYRAWARRSKVASLVVEPLSCYVEVAPFELRGLIQLHPKTCQSKLECCLADRLRKNLAELKSVVSAVDSQPEKPENSRRSKALKAILTKKQLSPKQCRDLGDAVFVLCAPVGSVILTTNLRDFNPLADAVGKEVEAP